VVLTAGIESFIFSKALKNMDLGGRKAYSNQLGVTAHGRLVLQFYLTKLILG